MNSRGLSTAPTTPGWRDLFLDHPHLPDRGRPSAIRRHRHARPVELERDPPAAFTLDVDELAQSARAAGMKLQAEPARDLLARDERLPEELLPCRCSGLELGGCQCAGDRVGSGPICLHAARLRLQPRLRVKPLLRVGFALPRWPDVWILDNAQQFIAYSACILSMDRGELVA